jgi:ATP-dependent RNA helicase SUPV3L1/SUV3
VDILERLADLIRPLLSWRAAVAGSAPPPKGATGDGGFTIIPEMMSILGCSSEELGEVLKTLGFRVERRPAPKHVPAVPVAVEAAELAADTTAAPVSVDVTADGDLAEDAGDTVAVVADTEPVAAPAEDVVAGEAESAEASAKSDEATPAEAVAAPVEAPAEQTPVPVAEPEMTYIEIWRPRRRQRSDRHGPRAMPGEAPREGAQRHGQGHQHGKKDRHQRPSGRPHQDRRDRRNKDEKRRRPDDRPRPEFRSASPKKATVDPDSPFAALSALRSELEKRAKEQGTT